MDAIFFTLFVHMLTVENRLGWGLFRDQRYLMFGFLCITMYVLLYFTKAKLFFKIFTVMSFILVTVIGVGGSYIQVRHVNGATLGINDAGLQNEIGGKFLLLGKNPYSVTYFDTDLEHAPYSDEANSTVNPALYHFAYPPFSPILTAGTFRLLAPRLGWFDVRVIYLASLLLLLFLGYFKWGITEKFILFLILIGLNPYFVRSTIEGSNDVVAIMLLIAAILLFEKGKALFWSGVLFGLAIATKQIIWPVVPFFLVALWQTKKEFFRFFIGCVLAIAATFGPFVIWDFQGLINGLLLYHSGSLPHSYPIHNFGFGMLLWQLGVVKGIYDYYPFGLWQAIGILFVIAVVFRIRKTLTNEQMVLAGWVGCLFVLFLFNRAMNYSYLGIMQVVLALAVLWGKGKI